MSISKLDAARIQLDAAIDHFFQGDHVCTVTLAGAAEDIFAGLLKASGQQSAFEFLYDWYEEKHDKHISKRDFSRQIANRGRNWLKHANDDAHTKLDISKQDSLLMLTRALPCYHKLTRKHTQKMKKYFQYLNDNINEIDKLFSNVKA